MNLKSLLQSNIGRLRLLGFIEGISLLVLVLIAVPLKYIKENETLTHLMGPIHGALFLLFVINTLSVGLGKKWRFSDMTWKILVACMIPFGTFYIDHKILKPEYTKGIKQKFSK